LGNDRIKWLIALICAERKLDWRPGRVYFLTLLVTLAGRPDSGPYRQVGQPVATVWHWGTGERLIYRSCRVSRRDGHSVTVMAIFALLRSSGGRPAAA
jgi:hypothetical protein